MTILLVFQISLGFHMLIGCVAQHLNVAVLLLLLHPLPDQSLHLYPTHERLAPGPVIVLILRPKQLHLLVY